MIACIIWYCFNFRTWVLRFSIFECRCICINCYMRLGGVKSHLLLCLQYRSPDLSFEGIIQAGNYPPKHGISIKQPLHKSKKINHTRSYSGGFSYSHTMASVQMKSPDHGFSRWKPPCHFLHPHHCWTRGDEPLHNHHSNCSWRWVNMIQRDDAEISLLGVADTVCEDGWIWFRWSRDKTYLVSQIV